MTIENRPERAFTLAVFGPRALASLSGPLAFAFLGGYADAAGYILTGTFTGHVTGAVVLTAISAAAGEWRNFILRLGGIASFLIGVATAESLSETFRLSRHVLTLVIAIELILFSLACLAARQLNTARALLVMCLCLALGLQNGALRRLGSAAAAHTTFLTGLSIRLVATETDKSLLHTSPASSASSLKMPADVGLAFFLGATFGATATLHFHAGGVLGAVILLLVMMIASEAAHSSAGQSLEMNEQRE